MRLFYRLEPNNRCVINSSRCSSGLIIVLVVCHQLTDTTNQRFIVVFTHVNLAGCVCGTYLLTSPEDLYYIHKSLL